MSIWGKVIGGAAGFALGGPLGALLGALAGHVADRAHDQTRPDKDGLASVTFTIGVIVLGAKMAKADGRVTRDEVKAFREVFRIPPAEEANVAKVFNLARRDSAGFEPYARQIASLLRDRPAVLEELLDGLFHIARADGQIHGAELSFLEKVARIFGFDENEFERIKASNLGADHTSPFSVLGVAPDASDKEIKAAYRRLIKEHHPDRLIAQGLPEEFISIANDKLAAINAAYDRIVRMRGLS